MMPQQCWRGRWEPEWCRTRTDRKGLEAGPQKAREKRLKPIEVDACRGNADIPQESKAAGSERCSV